MRSYDSNTMSHLAARSGVKVRILLWVTAKNRTNGLPESLGVWNGDEDITVHIDGVDRDYVGAGGLLDPDPVRSDVGLDVRMHEIRVSPLDDTIVALLRGFDARLAPIEMHRVFLDPETNALVGPAHRVFRGEINKLDLPEMPAGSEVAATITAASASRRLTLSLPLKKSDESQRLRGGDRFRRYGDISGGVSVFWGEKRSRA